MGTDDICCTGLSKFDAINKWVIMISGIIFYIVGLLWEQKLDFNRVITTNNT